VKVYMLKDVENVGLAGTVVKVSDGYAANFLLPRKLAKKVGSNEEAFFEGRVVKAKIETQAINSKIGMLAEKIKNTNLVIKERIHDNGKLYGSVGADEVVELLKAKDITVNRKQIEFKKAIKTVGEHSVIVKLSAKLKPELTLKVVAQEAK
jgi:large subunit ribosomal protein L9